MTCKFNEGDRIILARHSKAQGDFGIFREDYGRCGVITHGGKHVGSNMFYCVRLDGGQSWNATEDQLDREEGPW